MDTSFEEFAKMAKEEFGLTVVKSANNSATFESIFGDSLVCMDQYELLLGYYDNKSMRQIELRLNTDTMNFNSDKYFAFAV